MKTIKQLADDLGVSKDKVKYQVRKLPSDMVVKSGNLSGGKFYITETGEALISGVFSGVKLPESEEFTRENDRVMVEFLKNEIQVKNTQIEALQNQLKDITDVLTLTQQTAATAQALHAGTIQAQLADPEAKPGFFARLFGRT